MAKAEMPVTRSLMERGCYTLKKRAVLPSSSAVNWASMFMGAGPELHGYTEWGSCTPELPSRVVLKNNIFPTIFQLYRDACPDAEIGVLSEWDGIKYLVDTLSTSYHAVAPDYEKHPEALCEMSERYIKDKKTSLVAICFDNPDHVGHKKGHDTPEYYSKLAELDGYIGRIVKAVEDAGMMEHTIFILTSIMEASKKAMAEKPCWRWRLLLSLPVRISGTGESLRKAWCNTTLPPPWLIFSGCHSRKCGQAVL